MIIPGVKNKKIYIGLSGGVDSSVAATLLVESGAQVVGVYIKGWTPSNMECSQNADRLDAMRVAAHLEIPFLTLDFSREYKKEVIDYFVKEYKIGNTPNPDILCNSKIKFGFFFDYMKKQKGDFLATGHYANIAKKRGSKFLTRGLDKSKDQSYFLWKIKSDQLNHIIFPLGKLEKKDVRQLAINFKLPTAHKKDSQGICFVGQIDVDDFLIDSLKLKEGLVLNEYGEVIGEHRGAMIYTIGQRHGFKVNKPKNNKPYYCIDKDIKNNKIIVSQNINKNNHRLIILKDENWITEKPQNNKKYVGQIRHLGDKLSCRVKYKNKVCLIELLKPVNISLGQSLVVYDKDICLGGGIISSFC